MPKTRFIQNSFTSGVLSPLTKGRTDIQQYYQALEQGDNVVLMPQGGLRRRPGTKHIENALPVLNRRTETPTMPEGGTPGNINDDNDSTTTATTNNIGTTDPYVVAQYDLGGAVYIENVDIRQIKLTVSGTSTEFVVQSSPDGAAWTTRATVPTIGTTAFDTRLKVAVSDRYFRLARVGSTDLTTNRIELAEFHLNEKTATLSKVELKDFSVSTDTHYLLAFTDKNCRIFKDGVQVADIETPYVSDDVNQLRVTQSESVMIVVHEDYPPRRIINLQTDTDWSTEEITFTNIPQFDYDDSSSPTPTSEVQDLTFNSFTVGQQFQLDIKGVLSKSITYAGSGSAAEQSATAENIRKNLQDMPVFGETGITVAFQAGTTYRITCAGESADAFELFSGFPTTGAGTDNITFNQITQGSPRKEDVWSSTRGYPKTVAFYEGRLVFGGTKSKNQSLFMSKSGLPFDFDTGEGLDDEAIFITIATRKLNEITDVFPGRRLQIFTAGGEFTIKTKPITPASITVSPETSHGANAVQAREIDGATLFIDRNGKTIREYLYSFNEDAYVSNDISVLSPELITQPVDMAILGGTNSDDANWVFVVNNDGSATILNTLRGQDINGFTRWTTSGFLTNVSVVDDDLYMVNKRTINSAEVYVIEQWSFDYHTDNGIIKTFGSPTTSVTGLDHLEGETVRVVGDGAVMNDKTVSSGAITLENPKSSVQVGLNYTPTFTPMPINTSFGAGGNQMRLKRIVRMNIRVQATGVLKIDGEPIPARAFADASASPLGSAPALKTGILDDILDGNGWNREDMPVFTQDDPLPMQVLAIEYEVESS